MNAAPIPVPILFSHAVHHVLAAAMWEGTPHALLQAASGEKA